MKLRYYQNDAVDAANKALKQNRNPLIVAPTGSGKSLMIAELCKMDAQILVVTPRVKLLQQNAKLIEGAGILSGRLGNDDGTGHRVVVATYQTLLKRSHKTPEVVIIDEAHLIPEEDDSGYKALLESYQNAQFIGLTATPFRQHATIFGSQSRWFKAFDINMLKLIREGYLVPPRSYKTYADTAKIETDALDNTILRAASAKLKALGRGKTVIFCRDIDHVKQVTALLEDSGENVTAVHSEQPKKQVGAACDAFESCKSACFLVNCNMLTTGVDLPKIDSIILLRKISTPSLYIQVIGRGLRTSANKQNCVILDYYGNRERFGAIDSPNFAGGSHTYNSRPSSPADREKICPLCELYTPLNTRICKGCGFEFVNTHLLKIESSDRAVLSIDLRQGKVSEKKVLKKGSVTRLQYTTENGDKVIHVLSGQGVARQVGDVILYRVSGGIPRIINNYSSQ